MPKKRGTNKPSRRFVELSKGVDPDKQYSVEDAVDFLKKMPKRCKFDETIDLAIKLDIDSRQADQLVRGSFALPKGTGKVLRVVCFADGALAEQAKAAGAVEAGGEELAKKIQEGWLEFDVAIAHPATMRFVGRLGKVLGPKGLMPSPKSGTVTPDVVKAVQEFKGGKIEYRNDQYGNVHVPVGKLSFSKEALIENIRAMIGHIRAIRPASVKGIYMKSIHISSTMGPGLSVVTA